MGVERLPPSLLPQVDSCLRLWIDIASVNWAFDLYRRLFTFRCMCTDSIVWNVCHSLKCIKACSVGCVVIVIMCPDSVGSCRGQKCC